MGLVKCKECGAEISSKAKECPHCGHDNRSWWGRRHIVTKAFIVFFGLMFVAALFGGGEEGSTSTGPAATPPPKEYIDISFNEFDSLFGMEGSLTDAQKKVEFEKYKGKYVRWTCELVDVSESLMMSLRCKPSTFTSDMSVKLRSDQKEKALEIPKGAMVTFEARLKSYGELLGHSADDGVIISWR
ncbi:zinc-ribbon domain-containing protein [Candidatus Pyrohabitans sp.]